MSESVEEERPAPANHREVLERLAEFTTEAIIGRERLGVSDFTEAPKVFDEIVKTLRELTPEELDGFPAELAASLRTQELLLLETVEQMTQLSSEDEDFRETRDALMQSLEAQKEWVRECIQPRAIEARVKDTIARSGTGDAAQSDELEKRLREADARAKAVEEKLAALESVAEAARVDAGATAAGDLATFYKADAGTHKKAWRQWGKVFLGSTCLALIGSVLVVSVRHPHGRVTDASVASRLVVDVLVIGILLYVVRLASLQFRVHRHLEAVATNKAAALDTFARITTSGAEPSTRDAIAVVLAQAVFTSDDSGFIDAGNDHITLIERMAPMVQRMTAP